MSLTALVLSQTQPKLLDSVTFRVEPGFLVFWALLYLTIGGSIDGIVDWDCNGSKFKLSGVKD